MADEDDGFLSRWSRRKVQVREGRPAAVEAVPPTPPSPPPQAAALYPAPDVEAEPGRPPVPAPPPAPTLEEAQALTPTSDFRRFVTPDVAPDVRHTALKQLFADPQFNVMDGLDTYIDDYGKPDPLPAGMLRKMTQSAFLNLFADDPPPAPETAAPPSPAYIPPEIPPDEDPDLRLQPHDAPGPPGPDPGPEPDPGRER